jgi:hypothetical protein
MRRWVGRRDMHPLALLLWREAMLFCALDTRATKILDADLVYIGSYILEAQRCLVAWDVAQQSPVPRMSSLPKTSP